MRRFLKVCLWIVAALIALPLLLVVAVLVLANVDPGRRLIEREARSLTGGMVTIEGLGGRFPDALRVRHLAVADAQGVYASADDVALDWSPLSLLGRSASIQSLTASGAAFLRLPVAPPAPATGKPAPAPAKPFHLPVRVTVEHLAVARFSLGQPVVGVAAVLKLAGRAHLDTLTTGSATIAADRLDAAGTYRVDGVVNEARIDAHVAADEPPAGLIASLAKLPALGGPLTLRLDVAGPRSAEQLKLALAGGPLHADAHGSVDIPGSQADLDLTASAPAMTPRPDVAWQKIDVTAHVHGPFSAPDAVAHVLIDHLAAGGAGVGTLQAEVSGNKGVVDLAASLVALTIPGPKPDVLAADPVKLTAHVRLDAAARPVAFTLAHPLLQLAGTIDTGGALAGHAHAVIPDMTPLAAVGGIALDGHASVDATLAEVGRRIDVTIAGLASVTGGLAPVPGLIGDDAKIAAAVSLDDGNIAIHRVDVAGRTLRVGASGSDDAGALDIDWTVALSDLRVLAPSVSGHVDAAGHVAGPPTTLGVDATAKGVLGTTGFAPAPLTLAAHVAGLPGKPAGTLTASATLEGAALTLAAKASRGDDGTLHVVLDRADWKSIAARADLLLAKGATLPTGSVSLRAPRLADLAGLAHQPITGALEADVRLADVIRVQLDARDAGLAAERVGRLTLAGTVRDATSDPTVALALTADGIAANGTTGSATLSADGPQTALALKLGALLRVAGADATVAATARLDAKGRTLTLASLAADYKTLPLRLVAPARISFGDGVSVDHVRLALQQASLALAGSITPTLDLTAQLRNVTPALAKPFAPGLQADGSISADARLSGTTDAPSGTVRLVASGLHDRSGQAAALPPANALATVALNGATARLDAHVEAGPRLHLAAAGTVPLAAAGALDVRTTGSLDLAMLDPILQAGGRRVRGLLALDLAARGTVAAPQLAGTVRLTGGDVQDYAQGLRLTNVAALIEASGQTITLASLTATAGPGTIEAHGTVGALAPTIPVDIVLTMHHARPLASDLLTATLDANLTVRGQAKSRVNAGGTITIERADINIPNSFPPSVAKLDVRRPGDKPPAAATGPALLIGLALDVDAPGQVFVRGHGLDAELGGRLTVGGTSAAPQIGGGFDLRQGSFSLAGTTLTFTKGRVGFDGTGVAGKIDPTLDFEADSTSGSTTATLKITGYADAPKIGLSSTPELPQDEVLAYLLFHTSTSKLSAFQIAEIAGALAEISGVGGGGGDVLGGVRKRLGLDRLSVGGGTSGSGASVQAGRYVAKGVYVGAKQGTSGGTQAQVQVDLTRRLKLQTTVGTGGGTTQGATPENDPGSSVGLTYQFEY